MLRCFFCRRKDECVHDCRLHPSEWLLYQRERERENFSSPFSQHWLMRTRLGWCHQPSREWLLGSGRQRSGPCATQNTAWYHLHLDTTYQNGGECGQNEGSQKQNAFHLPMPWSRTQCSGGDAGGWLVWQAYPAQLAKHESPCGIASAAAA